MNPGFIPRIRLSTLFFLIACVAVGLATDHEVAGAIRPAIETAMVIGLLQEMRELTRWRPAAGCESAAVQFARSYAIIWRLVVATTMTFFLVCGLTGWSPAILFPKRNDLVLYEPTTAIRDLLPIIVLANSVRRWRRLDYSVSRRSSGRVLFVIPFLLLTLYNVIDARLVEYLVHQSMAGIEASIPPQFQRPDVYPDHASEGFRDFWLALTAATSVPLGAFCLIRAARRPKLTASHVSVAVFVSCLTVQLLYCHWFYMSDYYRVSPDLAGAGFALGLCDLLSVGILLATVTTSATYFLSALPQQAAIVSTNLAVDLDHRAFHETAACLVVMSLNAVFEVFTALAGSFHEIFFPTVLFSQVNLGMQIWLKIGFLCSPLILIAVAPPLLTLQLAYYRWNRRGKPVPWALPALSPNAFALTWLAVAAAVLLGVPTLAAFGFMFWLGPFSFWSV